ncbi:MAG: hypothetical protein NZ891_06955 [bacterium]|nr:hypothetical protein [bacterium]MDW8164463.1 hypothetical protein [Candidatus Omnitrophota bacterium]
MKKFLVLLILVVDVFSNNSEYPVLGINLSGIAYWSTEHAFKDLMKYSSKWRAQKKDDRKFTWDNPLPPMDENGYPLEIGEENLFLETFILSVEGKMREHLGEKLYVLYEGKGRIDYWGGWKVIERKEGMDVLKLEEKGPLTLRIYQTDKSDHLRNIRVLEEKYLNNYKENPFREEFLNRWKKMKVFRFMDWMETNNSKITKWEERPKVNDRTYSEKGVPVEIMIDLCNKLKINPWFCMPHKADDEYVKNFAKLTKEKLNKDLSVYIEYSNEVWNSIFAQAGYSREKGTELKLSDNPYQAQLFYYSKRAIEIFKIWEEVFGNEKSRLIRVLASQSANPWVSQQVLEFNENYKNCDALGIAPYFGHSYGSPKNIEKVENMTADDIFRELPMEIEKLIETCKKHKSLCEKYNLKLVAYEGGQHFVGHGGAENNDKLNQLFFSVNRDPKIGDIYRIYLKKWKEIGGDVFVLFSSMTRPSKWGSWGLLEYETQKIDEAPKFKAIFEILNR